MLDYRKCTAAMYLCDHFSINLFCTLPANKGITDEAIASHTIYNYTQMLASQNHLLCPRLPNYSTQRGDQPTHRLHCPHQAISYLANYCHCQPLPDSSTLLFNGNASDKHASLPLPVALPRTGLLLPTQLELSSWPAPIVSSSSCL